MTTKIFVCSASSQKDWWRRYRIEIEGCEAFFLRSGEGRWLDLDVGTHAMRVSTGAVEDERRIRVGEEPSGVSISGDSKFVLAGPKSISIADQTDNLSSLPILDWRASGYTPAKMILGYALLFGIFLALLGIIVVPIVARGAQDLFMLIWLPGPLLVLDMILRSLVGLARASSTRKLIGGSAGRPPKSNTPQFVLGLAAMALCIAINLMIDRLGWPVYVSVPVLVASLAAIVLIGRHLRAARHPA